MNILAIDIGGNNVKFLATGRTESRKFPSGPTLTPTEMVEKVRKLAADWDYDVVSVGYPGRVANDRPTTEPNNLAKGWVGFDFAKAFGRPTKVINDAAMQALGSYRGGTLLFLGFGTGLGSALIVRGHIVPMELGALPLRDRVVEDFVGRRGLERSGKKKWRKHVERLVERLMAALLVDETVIGGGNAKFLRRTPAGSRLGDNSHAFIGGFRLWEPSAERHIDLGPEPSVHDVANDGTGARA